MNLNNVSLIKHNGAEIELIKLGNGPVVYQNVPLYMPYEFRENGTITEVRTMVNKTHTDLSYMFFWCYSLASVNTQNWNTSNVTTMKHTFSNCTSLETLNLSRLNTSNVTTMFCMFSNSNNLQTIGDVSNWNTSKVLNMDYMFSGCTNLTTLNLSNWNTSKVTTMSQMFFNCTNLETLDLSNWDTSNVGTTSTSNMWYIFSGCTSLHTLRLDNCSSDTIHKIMDRLDTPETTTKVNGETRKIFCKQANASGLNRYLPVNWEFVYVDEQ